MAKQEKNNFSHELVGISLIFASFLLGLSLVSYDFRDLPLFKTPPTSHNYVGIVGAYTGFALYSLIGWSANMLPLAATYLASCLLIRNKYRFQLGLIGLLVFLLSLSCLTQVLGWGETGWVRKVNSLQGIGGLFGYFVGRMVFQRWLGPCTFLIFLGGVMIGLFLAIQIKPKELIEWFKERRKEKKVKQRQEALRSGDLKTVLRTREEEIAERQKAIERELVQRSKNLPSSASATAAASSKNVSAEKTLSGASPAPAPSPNVASTTEAEKPAYKINRTVKPKAPAHALQTVSSGPYHLPSTNLLRKTSKDELHVDSKEEVANKAALIETTLKDFGIEVRMGEITQGATFTRYEVIPSPGVKVERIVSLQNNLSLALKTDKVNILAPVAGKGTVGIEVANSTKAMVLIRELVESQEFQASKGKIPLALGKDVYGRTLIADLADMPHLLIAGSTGAGKSVCINSILASILYKFTPEDCRLILIDPKVVELQAYNSLPHLVVPVVSDPKKVIVALRWVIREMEKRYKIMAKVGVRNITAFNSRPQTSKTESKGTEALEDLKKAVENADEIAGQPMLIPEDEIVVPDKMPFIIIFVDELADLMLTAPVDAEDAITRITQMARAAGIHLVVATQTPRADVVTGTIKTNLPSKISFRVASKVDSRVILDENGAENLFGKGDMIYKSSDSSTLRRAQGAYISDDEVHDLVDFCAKQAPASYDVEIHERLSKTPTQAQEGSDEDETLIEQCIQVIRQEGRASTSLLQRRLRLGYTRAARIMDVLEERGMVGPGQGAKDREILMRMDGTPSEG